MLNYWLLIGSKLLASAFVMLLQAAVYAGYDGLTIWKRNKLGIGASLNHKSRHFLRLTLCVCVAWCSFGPTWLGLAHACLLASIFFLAFDPILNSVRDLAWDYVSDSNAWDLAWLRRFGARAGRIAFRCELVALVVLLTAFVLVAFFTSPTYAS